MIGRSDHLEIAVERARVRKVFGLPPLVTRFDIEVDAWNATERIMLGDLANWKPEGLSGMSGILGIEPGA